MTYNTTDYSQRDFTASLERLLGLLQQELPEYTDQNQSDVGTVLMGLLARESDQLQFYLDQAFAEGFIDTARYKQSLIDLANLVGYGPKLASAASTTLRISRKEDVTDVITVPQYSAFSRVDGITYLNTSAVTMASGVEYVDVNVLEGEPVTLTVDPDEITTVDKSGHQKYNLGKDVATDSVVLQHGDPAVTWTQVDSFYNSQATDYHFRLELYADKHNNVTDTVWLVFGNGTYGREKPTSDLTVSYIKTNGADGNCGSNRIDTPPTSLVDLVTCNNSSPATGGAGAESIANLRRRIPQVTRTQRRAVTLEDYKALVESVTGVKYCQAQDRNDSITIPYLYVLLYVVPEGGGTLSDYTRSLIQAELQAKGHLGTWSNRYIIQDAVSVPTNITCTIGLEDGYGEAAVKTAINTALQNLFNLDNLGIGTNLAFADIHSAVSGVSGVSYVEFTEPIATVTAQTGELLTLGTVTIQVVA